MELTQDIYRAPISPYRRILGIEFFGGSAQEAIIKMRRGGLLVVPAAPALKDLPTNGPYREALLNADLVITDSSFMVLVWNVTQRDHVHRLSGLAYLRELLFEPEIRQPGNTLWVMASAASASRNLSFLGREGIHVPSHHVYLAPIYHGTIDDAELVEKITRLRPQHVIVTLGGGTQERLGLYLKRNLGYLPSIHCIGAAIAFLSGDQVHIPVWADRCCVGWAFRGATNPKQQLPKYWKARPFIANDPALPR